MGFWSNLGHGLAKAAPIVAAGALTAATGGAAAPTLWGTIAGAAGAGLSGAADAAAQNRGEQTNDLMRRDALKLQAARDLEGQKVDRAKIELERQDSDRTSEADAYKKALKSALAMHMQDVHMARPEGVPNINFSGGARPSAIGDEGRQAAALLNSKALQHLMTGDTHMDMGQATETPLSEMPKASIWEKLAGIGGLGLSTLGAISSHMPAQSAAAPGATIAGGPSVLPPALRRVMAPGLADDMVR